MGLAVKLELTRKSRTEIKPINRQQAYYLLFNVYSARYGTAIRYENPRTMRVKILELQAHLDTVRLSMPAVYQALARQITDYERICAILEMLG
ncbi:hypothetical protein LUCX_253 [Xanthomonas phage vB_XciM_LucasX]|nr:hypothetical protein LUCX_253 [Xanthomonas phage vB_XciM_LucasX]